MPNGRVSSSMEEPFYITAVPDPSVAKPSDEDLPKVRIATMKIIIHLCNLLKVKDTDRTSR